MPFFGLTPSGPRPNPKSHPALLAGLRKMVAQARVEGRSDSEIRQQLLEEVSAALPENAGPRGGAALEEAWRQVVEAILAETP